MPRFAANLTMLFNELPFLERFDAACRAGYTGIEYLFPYAYAVEDLVTRLRRYGLRQVLHNLPAGAWATGERGIACIPGREADFRDGVEDAVRYAAALGCKRLNCLVGIAPSGVESERIEATLLENLRHADGRLTAHGIELLIEPVNTRDIPGFYLNRTGQARRLIEMAGLRNTFIQYDIYHMQIMEGDLARTLEANLDLIRHVQLADNPGRNEPGTGEINFPFLFGHLDAIGYDGWVGCEYKPRGQTQDGLSWRPASAAAAKAVA